MHTHRLPIKFPVSNSSTQARQQDCPALGPNGTQSSKHSKSSMRTAGECSACPYHMCPILDDVRMMSMLAGASLPAMVTTRGNGRARATARAAAATSAAGASSVPKHRQSQTSRRGRTHRKCLPSPAAAVCFQPSSPCTTMPTRNRRPSVVSLRARPLMSLGHHLEHVRVNVSASAETRHPAGLVGQRTAHRCRSVSRRSGCRSRGRTSDRPRPAMQAVCSAPSSQVPGTCRASRPRKPVRCSLA